MGILRSWMLKVGKAVSVTGGEMEGEMETHKMRGEKHLPYDLRSARAWRRSASAHSAAGATRMAGLGARQGRWLHGIGADPRNWRNIASPCGVRRICSCGDPNRNRIRVIMRIISQ